MTTKVHNGATGTASCIASSSGICSISKTGLSTRTTSVTFSVTGITAASLTYQPAASHTGWR